MNRLMVRPLVLAALLAVCGPIRSQAQQRTPRTFEGPPRLTEPARPGPAALAGTQAPCNPGTVSRKGNLVSVEIHYKLADFTMYNPDSGVDDRLMLRSYGGCKSGPLLELHPGNTLRLHLFNDLSADDPSCYPNPPLGLGLSGGIGPGCFNTINLHTHGLHVSPAGNGDNVLLNIAPQTEFTYEITIPDDHPSGTFWYHAHRHGSTAIQVASGASGALIVRGDRPYDTKDSQAPADIDTILHDKQGKPFAEQIFLLQQIPYACFNNDPTVAGGKWQQIWTNVGPFLTPPQQGVVPAIFDAASANYNNPPNGPLSPPAYSPFICPPQVRDIRNVSPGVIENFNLQLFSATIWDTNGRFTSVNGVVQPHLGADPATAIKAGEIQRWRFIHAGIHDTVNLEIVKAPQGSPIATSELTGNRQAQVKDLSRFCGDVTNPQNLVPRLIPQFEIATDGLTRRTMRIINLPSAAGPPQANYMQPGYRSDILVVFPSEGDYCLLDQAAPKGMRPINGGAGGGQGPSVPQLLAYVHVQAGQTVPVANLEHHLRQALYDYNSSLPADVRAGLMHGNLTPWAFVPSGVNKDANLAPAPASNVEAANFTITSQGFQINGASYDPNVVNFTRQVNTTDEWLLTAGPPTPTPNTEPHIFHIHVNPFEVIDITTADKFGSQASIFNPDGTCKVFPDPMGIPPDSQGLANQYCGMWHTFRDTIFIENGYQIHVRTRYDRYIGEYVLHCHILDHEDAGMMANVNIVPDLKAPGGGLGMPNMKHR